MTAPNPCWFLHSDAFTETLRSLSFPEEIITQLLDTAESLANDSAGLERFLAFREEWLAAKRDGVEDPALSRWNALVVASAFPAIFELHRERGIPWSVTVSTLGDLPRRMLNFKEVNGFWGFDAQRWMRAHIKGIIIQIGRLQYGIGEFAYPAAIYRLNDDFGHLGGTIALAQDGARCTATGHHTFPADATPDWIATLKIEDGRIIGHPIDEMGRVCREQTSIPASSPCVMSKGSRVLHVHIPMGSKLDSQACRESLEQALPFFERHFPETPWAGICCGSWLLDRAFAEFNPIPANIVAFGQLFTPLPALDPGDGGHFRWIFGVDMNREKAEQLAKKTSLQRAVLAHLASGRTLHCTAGYIVSASTKV